MKKVKSTFRYQVFILCILLIISLIFIFQISSDKELNKKENLENKTNETYLVTAIIDGDTFVIETGEQVRLLCVNSPEKNEKGYNESLDYLSELLLNKEVKLIKDQSEKDQYGRLLRYVYLKDQFVNAQLVKEKIARVQPTAPDTSKCKEIQESRPSILGNYTCVADSCNCDDFPNKSEAQIVFNSCGGPSQDIHNLDIDKDQEVCENLL